MANKLRSNPSDYLDSYNGLIYIINNVINNKINTAEIVRVIANNGDGTIDVMPVIRGVDAEENAIEETPVFGVKFFQWQYGVNAIMAQPAVGDVGLLIVCTKDTKNIQGGIVGDLGMFELESGIYLGGLFGFNIEPTQFINFTDTGIEITTDKDITVNGANVNVNATTAANVFAPVVSLGASGGKKVALDGDPVKSGNTVVGNIVASSTMTLAK